MLSLHKAYRACTTLLLLLLTACTMPVMTPGTTPQADPAASAPVTNHTAADLRTYTDALGRTIDIPTAPKRIVAHYYAAELVAMDIPLVGTNYNNATLVLSETQLNGIEDTGTGGIEPNIERILTLDPDLIIMPDFIDASILAELDQIAPTITVAYSDDPFTHLRTLAAIVGVPERAEAWIAAYQGKVTTKRAEVAPYITPGETATAFIITTNNALFVYGPQRLGPTLHDALGFTMPENVSALFADNNDLWQEISLELLPEYAGDRIFIVTYDTEEARAHVESITSSPLWQSLPAVQNGHAYFVTPRWAFNDAVTLDWLLDEATTRITSDASP